MSDYESNLMWKFYVNNNHGVTIRSTYGKLKASVDYSSTQTFTIGCAEYYNPLKHGKDIGNTVRPFVYKTIEYTSENEIRAIIQQGPTKDDPRMERTPEDYFLSVDLENLIDEIVISPWSPKWHINIYEEINKKFGIEKKIRLSTIE